MNLKRKRFYRSDVSSMNIPSKANRILNIILIVIILILLRVWHLTVVQHDERVEESRKPQRKTVVEPAKRGTIRDRFNIPLAANKIEYQAAVVYSQIRGVPAYAWRTDENGRKVKYPKRKEYISSLAALLSKELGLGADRLEDLIYSKASFYNQFPFTVKEEITEKEYYRLKMLEKDWPGIHVQVVPKRYYPLQKVGSDVLGYIGAINRQEYETIIRQIKVLSSYILSYEAGEDPQLPAGIIGFDDACQRIQELEAHAYTINDQFGKGGIEGRFEELLRGYHGKKSFYSDSKGNFLRELPGSRNPLSGQRILLTISSELQEYAETLLAQNEAVREAQVSGVSKAKKALLSARQPWIKGGAIIAMDPNNGEILALASYPRFNPNDFIPSGNPVVHQEKQSNIMRWFENETHLGDIWDQKRPIERERYDSDNEKFFEEQKTMDLATYMEFILPKDNLVSLEMQRMAGLENAIFLQEHIERLLTLSGQNNLYWVLNILYQGESQKPYKNRISSEMRFLIETNLKVNGKEVAATQKKIDRFLAHIPSQYEKVLLVDLCRVLVPGHLFSQKLRQHAGRQSLSTYRNASAAMVGITDAVKTMSKELFQELTFKPWRKENEKAFLKSMRAQEKASKTYQKPYIDYFDAQEKAMFQRFWKENQSALITLFLTGKTALPFDEEMEPYHEHFLAWHQELETGAHSYLSWKPAYITLQNALKGIDIHQTPDYLTTLRGFRQLDRPLLGEYRSLRRDSSKKQLEKHLAAAFYPMYGFGNGRSHAYRQATTQGSIFKLVTAYEALIQKYRKMEGEPLDFRTLNPLEIVDSTHKHGKNVFLGFNQDGAPIPRLFKGGRLLKSSSVGIGKLDVLKAIETSSNPYFSLLAGEVLESPEDLGRAARLFCFGSPTKIDLPAEIGGKIPSDLSTNRTGLYATAIGQHTLVVTPLQTAVFLSSLANGGMVLKPNIVKMSIANKLQGKQIFNLVNRSPIEVRRTVAMPDIIRNMLLEGMRRVVFKQYRDGLTLLSRFYRNHPEAISDYIELKDQFVGKTSTSEAMETLDLDIERGTNMYTHVWFGGIAFNSDILNINKETIVFKDDKGQPELVVVVYLKFGGFGREAAPVAAQVVKKWREIKEKHKTDILR